MAREAFEAAVDGGVLAGWVEGEGPPVLLLHGGPGLSYDVMDGLDRELLPGYRVAAFQQRGLAPSTTDGPFTVPQAVVDVTAVLDHLGWAQALVVGHSWGGHLVLHCAVAVPLRLLGGLAVDPLGGVGDGGNELFEAELMRRAPAEVRARADELDHRAQNGEGTEEDALEGLRLLWPGYFADPGSAPPWPPAIRLSVEAYGGLYPDLFTRLPGLEESLPGITVPLGVLVGLDSPIPPDAGRDTAARVPGAWVQEVAGAGHFPWVESPGCVRAAVDRLARHASSSSA